MQINTATSIQWIFVLILLITTVNSITWLGIARYDRKEEHELIPFSEQDCAIVSTNYGLKKRQTNFCFSRRHSYAMHGIIKAAQAAIYYCMQTFANRRWNCSTAEKLPRLHKDLEIGTQEQAIVHAFSSAALMYEISRRCSSQKIRHCSCGTDPTQTFRVSSQNLNTNGNQVAATQTNIYGGCADNIQIGMRYVKKFTGFNRMGRKNKWKINKNREKRLRNRRRLPYFMRKKRRLQKLRKKRIKRINGHNYEAGIQILLKNVIQKCKCHGASGSCTQKVCFRQLRRLDDVKLLQIMKRKYLTARYVEVDSKSNIRPVHRYVQRSLRTKSSATMSHSTSPQASSTVQMRQRKRFTRNLVVKRNTNAVRSAAIKKNELVFIQHSPDYCESDYSTGSLGTHNRLCQINVAKTATIHCDNMCCGRRYRYEMRQEKITCGCRIDSRFQIICNHCFQNTKKYYCS